MTFESRTSGQSASLFYYITISGLPGMWGTRSSPGVDYYGWYPTLLPKGLDTPIEEGFEVWAGVSQPSNMSFSITFDDVWDLWISRNIYVGGISQVSTNCNPDVATLNVVSTSRFTDEAKTLYVGLETMTYTGTTGTSFTGLTRGVYGSYPTYHIAEWDGKSTQYLGAYVSEKPLTFTGRTISLWVGTNPAISGPFSTDDKLVYTGLIESLKLSDDLTTIEIASNDILSVVEASVATRLPTARISDHKGFIWVDQYCCNFACEMPITLFDPKPYNMDIALIPTYLAADGLYTYQEVSQAIQSSILAQYSRDVNILLEYKSLDSGGGTRLVLLTDDTNRLNNISITVNSNSVLNQFGFDIGTLKLSFGTAVGSLWMASEVSPSPYSVFTKYPKKKSAVFFDLEGTDGFVGQGWRDFGGTPHGRHVRIGDQIYRWSTATVSNAYTGLLLESRTDFGSRQTEVIQIRHSSDPERERIIGGIALQDLEWPLAILYLICGGRRDSGDYSNGPWLGCCCQLPEALVDLTSFETAAADAEKVSIWVDKPTTLREIIEPILVTYQYGILTKNGKITLVQVPTGLLTDEIIEEIGHDDVITSAGISWDVPEDLIISTIKAINVGFDYALEEQIGERTLINGTQLATWGGSSPLEVDMRAQRSEWIADSTLSSMRDYIWPRWGGPFVIITLKIGSPVVWRLQVGDKVSITHTLIPQLAKQFDWAIGDYVLHGWVYRKSCIWRPTSERGYITVVVPNIDGTRVSGWAPTARSTGALGAKTIPLDDATHFRADDAVRAYKEGDESNAVTGTIGSVIGNVITIDSTGTLTHPVCVEFDHYSLCSSRQKNYTFVALDDESVPSLPGGVDPFHYS